jgi:hypothetical protein
VWMTEMIHSLSISLCEWLKWFTPCLYHCVGQIINSFPLFSYILKWKPCKQEDHCLCTCQRILSHLCAGDCLASTSIRCLSTHWWNGQWSRNDCTWFSGPHKQEIFIWILKGSVLVAQVKTPRSTRNETYVLFKNKCLCNPVQHFWKCLYLHLRRFMCH